MSTEGLCTGWAGRSVCGGFCQTCVTSGQSGLTRIMAASGARVTVALSPGDRFAPIMLPNQAVGTSPASLDHASQIAFQGAPRSVPFARNYVIAERWRLALVNGSTQFRSTELHRNVTGLGGSGGLLLLALENCEGNARLNGHPQLTL
jgi:hypothetical protein